MESIECFIERWEVHHNSTVSPEARMLIAKAINDFDFNYILNDLSDKLEHRYSDKLPTIDDLRLAALDLLCYETSCKFEVPLTLTPWSYGLRAIYKEYMVYAQDEFNIPARSCKHLQLLYVPMFGESIEFQEKVKL